MGAFNPAASPEQSISQGLLDTGTANLFLNIAARAEVEPGSAQVLLGGIGTGKTTQLMLAAENLRQRNAHPFYAEVSKFTDLNEAGPGTLAAIVAAELMSLRQGKKIPDPDKRALNEFAHGRWVEPEPPDDDMGLDAIFVRGRLRQSIPQAVRAVGLIERHLKTAIASLALQDIVFFFDGMDRIENPETFWATVEPDLALFRRLQISIVVVAPWALAFRSDERLRQVFDRVHELRLYQTEVSDSMRNILSIRDKHKLLGEASLLRVCEFSGGIVRDLIMLARDAGEQAYLQGEPVIDLSHVAFATRNLGKSYSIGLDPAQAKRLKRIGTGTSEFSPSAPGDLVLLLSGRVLHRTPTAFQVHPALWSILLGPHA